LPVLSLIVTAIFLLLIVFAMIVPADPAALTSVPYTDC
jgi:hypothetical protein